MEHAEVLERLRGVLEHGKMGDKCLIAPDLVTAAIASLSAPQPEGEWVLVPREPTPEMLSAAGRLQACECGFIGDMSPMDGEEYAAMLAAAPQPPAEAHEDEVVCLECGQPTMHTGQVCYACLHPADDPAEAQPVAWMRRAARYRGVDGRQEGERIISESKVHDDDVPLYAHPPPSAPVGVEGLDTAAVEAGHITFESMKQCADSWLAVVDTLNTVAPGWSEKEGTGRECATAAIAALAQQPAAVDASEREQVIARLREVEDALRETEHHGLGKACGRMADGLAAQQPAAAGEEIMVNAAHDVYTLPLQPSGLSSGPRFVVHVPGPEQPAAVDEADAKDAEIEALRAEAIEWRGLFDMAKARADKAEARAERMAEALRLIAAPIRPDGTWNMEPGPRGVSPDCPRCPARPRPGGGQWMT